MAKHSNPDQNRSGSGMVEYLLARIVAAGVGITGALLAYEWIAEPTIHLTMK